MKPKFEKLLLIAFLFSVWFSNGQGSICENIEPFCAGNERLVFPNSNEQNTDQEFAEDGPYYDCLTQQPYPAWFFLQIENPGDLVFTIAQNTQANFQGKDLDVDFIVWGPFSRGDDYCSPDALSQENKIDCSYTDAAEETMTIRNAKENDIYVVLITNFQRDPGYISLQQNNPNAPGQGSTDCSILGNALGEDISVCGENEYVLDGSSNEASSYRWFRRFDGENDYTEIVGETESTLTVTQSGDYRLLLTDVTGQTSETADVRVNFYDLPEIGFLNEVSVCTDQEVVDLTENDDQFNLSNNNTFQVRYYGTEADANQDNFLVSPSSYNFTGNEELFARVYDAETGCLSEIRSFEVTSFSFPEVELSPEIRICISPEGVLVNNINLGKDLGSDFEYEWFSGNETLSSEAIFTLDENPDFDSFSLNVYSLETGCVDTYNVQLVRVNVPESLTAEISGSGFEENYQVTGIVDDNTNQNGVFEFRLDNSAWQSSAVFNNIEPGRHTLYARETSGCGGEISYAFNLVGFPKYFSPNGDGINDTWDLIRDNVTLIKRLYIFDRYGKLIKELDPEGSKGWDGTYNGRILPADDYWFQVQVEDRKTGNSQVYKNHFSLIK